jgi:hypothetical protein
MDFKVLSDKLGDKYEGFTVSKLTNALLDLHAKLIEKEVDGETDPLLAYEIGYLTIILEAAGYEIKERKVLFVKSKLGKVSQSIVNPWIEK